MVSRAYDVLSYVISAGQKLIVNLLRLKKWLGSNISLASLGGVGGVGCDWVEAIGRFLMCTCGQYGMVPAPRTEYRRTGSIRMRLVRYLLNLD